jgi:hypothetical protein
MALKNIGNFAKLSWTFFESLTKELGEYLLALIGGVCFLLILLKREISFIFFL